MLFIRKSPIPGRPGLYTQLRAYREPCPTHALPTTHCLDTAAHTAAAHPNHIATAFPLSLPFSRPSATATDNATVAAASRNRRHNRLRHARVPRAYLGQHTNPAATAPAGRLHEHALPRHAPSRFAAQEGARCQADCSRRVGTCPRPQLWSTSPLQP